MTAPSRDCSCDRDPTRVPPVPSALCPAHGIVADLSEVMELDAGLRDVLSRLDGQEDRR